MFSERENSPEVDLPDDVVAALRARYGHGPAVAETTDRAVLADAASHLNAVCRRQRRRRWIQAGLPLAAAAGLLLLLLPWADSPRFPVTTTVLETPAVRTPVPGPPAVPGAAAALGTAEARIIAAARSRDIDQDGQVNILDAFLLARTVLAGSTNPGSGDLNQDGVVDQRDIDMVAAEAVLLTMN